MDGSCPGGVWVAACGGNVILCFMDVALPNDLAKYVETLVEKVGYSNSSEVIAEALRQFQVSRPTYSVVMTPALERLLDEGMEDLGEAVTTSELRRK